MILGYNSPINNLQDWLEVATGDLVASAEKRIRLEIETHYAEATADHMVGGCPESVARARALAELGDPRTAARRFRKRHLTKWEAEKVEKALQGGRTSLVWGYLLSALLVIYIISRYSNRHFLSPLVLIAVDFVGLIVLHTVYVLVARSRHARSHIRLLILLTPVTVSLCIPPLLYFIGGPDSMLWMILLVSSWPALIAPLRLGYKLGKVEKNGDDTLPPGAVSS